MNICIYGAGAVGGHLAWRLHRAGATVSLVARGNHLAAIRADGLRLDFPDGAQDTVRLAASDAPAELGAQDAVIVAVKAPALPEVARNIAPLLGPGTAVVFAMNGIPWWYFHAHGGAHEGRRLPALDPGDALWRAVTPERALGGVVYTACHVAAPGVVRVEDAGPNRMIVGEPDGRITPRAQALADLLTQAGMATRVSAAIRDDIWTKLASNISNGTLCVAAGADFATLYREPAARAALHRLVAEARAVAAAWGRRADIDADEVIRRLERSRHKPSILQDYERRRPMEVDAVYRIPLELARLAGVATPTLDLMVGLLTIKARAIGAYP